MRETVLRNWTAAILVIGLVDWVVMVVFVGFYGVFVSRRVEWVVKESRNCLDEPIDWLALVYFSRTLREGREVHSS